MEQKWVISFNLTDYDGANLTSAQRTQVPDMFSFVKLFCMLLQYRDIAIERSQQWHERLKDMTTSKNYLLATALDLLLKMNVFHLSDVCP